MSKYWTIISGTNRPDSNSRKVAGYLQTQLQAKIPEGDQIKLLDLTELPNEIFSPAAYSEKPSSFEPFVEAVLNSKAILSVVAEYNGSFPGVFKYFIDMLPFPQSLQGVACHFVGVAAGRFGAMRSVEQAHMIFNYRNAYVFPESTYIMGVHEAIDEAGRPIDQMMMKITNDSLDRFVDFANCHDERS